MYWQVMRDQDPPVRIRDYDVAFSDHLQFLEEIPREERHDAVRGQKQLAIDEEGNVTDQPLLEYQHHIHGSVVGPPSSSSFGKGSLGRHD